MPTRDDNPITHTEMVNFVANMVRSDHQFYPVFTELHVGESIESPDVLVFNGAVPHVHEIKVSQDDINRDAQKAFRMSPSLGIGAGRCLWIPRECTPHPKAHDGWAVVEYWRGWDGKSIQYQIVRETTRNFNWSHKALILLLARRLDQNLRQGQGGDRVDEHQKAKIVKRVVEMAPVKLSVAERALRHLVPGSTPTARRNYIKDLIARACCIEVDRTGMIVPTEDKA